MRRRDFLGTMAATLLAPAAASAREAAPLAPIAWQDVPLLDGNVMRAETLRSQPVVVEFWASWCPFCRRQNPVLQQLHEATQGRGLQVLTFTLDIDAQKARDYLREHRYTFAAAQAGSASSRWFGARRSGLPELYVVDVRGQVAFHEADEMFPEDILALARFAST